MILDRFRIDDQVAIVTGASRGLGAAIAVAFAEAGGDVVIAARSESDLAQVAERIRAAGRRAHAVAVDLADPDAAAALAQTAVDEFGRLDTVVNNVGGAMPRPLFDTSPKHLRDAFDFNVGNAHALVVAGAKQILATTGQGSIINITSAVGRVPGRAYAAYGTAKAALAHYTRIAAMDLNPKIRVNGIAPGAILTSALEIVAGDEGMRTEVETSTPLHRLGDPEDIAAAALYLASPAGAYVTGKILEVDGGIIAPNLDLPIPDL
ncbi:SDR family oxidoreductase [Gordonia hongkongensis]|uniref:SDR family oxidoreductase n=1 Tax=Gordonia hongkongensis TaxID=1701090 RepID=A0AAX3T6D0_9ACTN|nr:MULTISPECIES: SDR family oxidoreductase [Gordonia]OCW85831.1 short-chain dehydrogenase [Nocardia farcinica]QIK46270.1 SDR family oxidoreductase [Gordonia terrae]MBN0975519.1 SDR family oxidoreductase [Gordonia sp. BP-119]MBN0985635.1 SDR family oxidoreductase [Gordonia sp. BP-94]MCT1354712.1 SDR family oxidoreductase [Gordonia sp. p3-SID1431]